MSCPTRQCTATKWCSVCQSHADSVGMTLEPPTMPQEAMEVHRRATPALRQQVSSQRPPEVLLAERHHAPCWPYRSRVEQRYAALLDVWVHDRALVRWRYEALRLTLAPRTTLTVDFWLTFPEGVGDRRMQLHETKGGWIREKGLIKLKQAAALYPEYRFFLVQYIQGDWLWKEVPTTA